MNPSERRPVKPVHRGRLAGITILTVLLAACIVGLLNIQNLEDYVSLRNYVAPAQIAEFATQDTMTPYARKVFYVNHPAVESKAVFATNCPNNGGEQTIVLGCYHSDQDGIYLLDVTDSRLNGVEQVTAAHETLHAIYDRLSSSERTKVDAMLIDYYQHDLTDPRIKSTIAAYMKTEPHDVVNEMHSVFGTEVANLPAPLEDYYKKYFTNRQAITNFAARYQAEFTSRQTQVTADDTQLDTLKAQIDDDQTDLATKLKAIQDTQQTLNSEKSNNQIEAYNDGVPGYNAQVNAYNSEVTMLQNLIAQYNMLVNTRNSIALEEQQLENALTTTPQQIK